MIGRQLMERRQKVSFSSPADWLREALGGGQSTAGATVSESSALGVPGVYAAVRVIAESIGSMPLQILRDTGDGAETPDPGSRLWELLHDRPCPDMDAASFWELVAAHMALRGNAFCWKQRDAFGLVTGLQPLRPERVRVGRADGEKIFEIDGRTGVTSREMLHFRAFGTDPLIGLSPIAVQRELIGRAQAEQDYQGRLLANNSRPGGLLTTPGRLGDEQAATLAQRWRAAQGGSNAGGVAVLEDGLTWQQTSLSVADQQFVEQRAMTRQEIAVAFRLPPDMLLVGEGGSLHYTSNESNGIRFLTYSLLRWMRRIEGALTADEDLPWTTQAGRFRPRFNAGAFLRMDTKTRYEAFKAAIDAGWMTPNEARLTEGMVPLNGLDVPRPAAASGVKSDGGSPA